MGPWAQCSKAQLTYWHCLDDKYLSALCLSHFRSLKVFRVRIGSHSSIQSQLEEEDY